MAVSTLFRLLSRPIMLFMLFVLFWAGLGPALVIGTEHGSRVMEAFRSGEPSLPLLHYALILGITLPAAFGLAAATASLELQSTRMSWMLPGLSRRLTTGIWLFALPSLVIVAWLTLRASDLPLAVASFVLGAFWFAALLHVPDAAQHGAARLALAGAFVACMVRPEAYVAGVAAQPAVAAAIAGLFAIALTRRHTDPGVRRLRMDAASPFQSGTVLSHTYWQLYGGTNWTWTRRLAGASASAWTAAAFYETIGTTRRGWAFLLAGHAVVGAIAYAVSPGMILILCFNLAFSGMQLRAGVLYPLSRRRRGRALFIGNFLDVALLAGIAGVTAAALAAVGFPRTSDAASGPPFELAMAVALMFAIAPIAQWARVRGPLQQEASKQLGRHVVYPIAAWAATVFVMRWLISDAASIAIGDRFLIIAVLVVAAQALHFLGIRWFHATGDLA